jgi:ABC-2 type transport system permease protein/sodium transport system permease protein
VLTPGRTIVATAVLFGLFHVLTGNALLIERFIPSTLMGLIIGWVAFRSGSVFPGMIVHLVHNGLLNLVMYYADRLNFLGQGFDDQTHLPPTWLAIAGTTAAIGALIVWFATRASVEAKLQLEPTT